MKKTTKKYRLANHKKPFWDALFEYLAILIPTSVTMIWLLMSASSDPRRSVYYSLMYLATLLGLVFATSHYLYDRHKLKSVSKKIAIILGIVFFSCMVIVQLFPSSYTAIGALTIELIILAIILGSEIISYFKH